MASGEALPHCDESPVGDDEPLTLRERALVRALSEIIAQQIRDELAADHDQPNTADERKEWRSTP